MTFEALIAREFGTLTELIRHHGETRPTATALIKDDARLDYAALNALMDRIAAGLQRDGLKSGDIIAICAKTSINYAALYVGALRAGVTVAPIAPSSTPAGIAAMVADCDAKLFFLDASVARDLATLDKPIAIPQIALDDDAHIGKPFDAWLAPAGAKPAPVAIDPDQGFNIIYSSGTTGEPKGIVQSFRMRWMQLFRAANLGYDSSVVTLLSTPLYSNTTMVCYLPTLGFGGTVVLMEKFDAAGYLALAERHRVTHTMLVPVQYHRIMALPDFDRYDLTSFRQKLSTSAPFSAALKADVLKRWPGGLTEYYGMTEGGGTCCLEAHLYPDKLHTVGKPLPGHDVRLIDEEGREVPQGEIGEVIGTSAAIMNGYYKRPDKTAAAEWFDANGTRYIRTGDVGRFDADGFLTLMDRKKDMIISGGFNIYPSDLEAVLAQHPDVSEAAVVGVPSQEWGETPVAFVVPKAGAKSTAEDLRAWTNARVGKTQRLAALRLLETLPRSAIGKVLKRELRDGYVA
jgi:acyl-CoA synthetase (AMP-forming)/AMP-acid ligase II